MPVLKPNHVIDAERWRLVLTTGGRFGLLNRKELVDVGYTRHQIDRLCRNGQLERIGSGWFSIPSGESQWQKRLGAFALSKHGLVADLSAAVMHGVHECEDLDVLNLEIVVPTGHKPRTTEGQIARQSNGFSSYTATHVDRIPVAEIGRTLLDIGAHYPFEIFRDCTNNAIQQRKTSVRWLKTLRSRQSWRRRGARKLDDALELFFQDEAPLSNWSSWAADRIAASGLQRPLLEHRVIDPQGTFVAQVDLFWPEFQLVVELDGRAFHSDPAQMAEDRRRDAALAALGLAVIRFTWDQYVNDDYFIETLRRVISARAA